jgi:hypothetical protein
MSIPEYSTTDSFGRSLIVRRRAVRTDVQATQALPMAALRSPIREDERLAERDSSWRHRYSSGDHDAWRRPKPIRALIIEE